MLGFIFMVDPFREENGATRFVPHSHNWPDLPSHLPPEVKRSFPGEVPALGEAGSLIVLNGAIWHSHTANTTPNPRRSNQGYLPRSIDLASSRGCSPRRLTTRYTPLKLHCRRRRIYS